MLENPIWVQFNKNQIQDHEKPNTIHSFKDAKAEDHIIKLAYKHISKKKAQGYQEKKKESPNLVIFYKQLAKKVLPPIANGCSIIVPPRGIP